MGRNAGKYLDYEGRICLIGSIVRPKRFSGPNLCSLYIEICEDSIGIDNRGPDITGTNRCVGKHDSPFKA